MADITCKDIFEKIPERFRPEGAGSWTATIQFEISGAKGGNFILRVAEGKCTLEEGTTDQFTAKVTTSDETWIGMTLGSVEPTMAFMSGELQVQGNIADVMKMNNPAIFERGN